MHYHIYLNFLLLICAHFISAEIDNKDDFEVYSVVSGSAHLPCNITPATELDGARLVLWYKNEDPAPIYSFDARYSTVKHWSEDPTFGPRAYFRDSSAPAQLIISSVKMEDAGVYKCRVDFRKVSISEQCC